MTRLYRSSHDRKITGLCGGLAQRIGMDPTLLRLLMVVGIFVTSGALIPIYFIAALVVPREPWSGGPGYGGPGYGGAEGYDYGHWGPQGSHHGSWKDCRRAEKHARKAQKYGWVPPQEQGYRQEPYNTPGQGYGDDAASPIDDMMEDIEKKAMWKEIERLRTKVEEYEKQSENRKQGGPDIKINNQ